eukprot:TRINITY_DN10703_c0_g2_i1.p1 TRINITY_DN10703_c0_g2~~TRINITY_DN10703_c0_g2_i1.p1  ORF type:complete len:399 (+),score=72.30 TRINITY_DN10703_c0_g2_i1:68-1264(+)
MPRKAASLAFFLALFLAVAKPAGVAEEGTSGQGKRRRRKAACKGVLRLDASVVSVGDIRQKYDGRRPVILTGAIEHWAARSWTPTKLRGIISASGDYPSERFVLQTAEGQETAFNSTTSKFLAMLEQSKHGQALYWMDEWVLQTLPGMAAEVQPPPRLLRGENFLELFPDGSRPPDALVVGGRGSTSSLHVDAYNWTGWHALLSGKKRWKLWPPSTAADRMYVQSLPYDVNHLGEARISTANAFEIPSADGDNAQVNSDQFPLLPTGKCGRPLEVLQAPGEVILLPSGWWHQAYHVTSTVAIASQYVNTANHRLVLCSLVALHSLDLASCLGSCSAGGDGTCQRSRPTELSSKEPEELQRDCLSSLRATEEVPEAERRVRQVIDCIMNIRDSFLPSEE